MKVCERERKLGVKRAKYRATGCEKEESNEPSYRHAAFLQVQGRCHSCERQASSLLKEGAIPIRRGEDKKNKKSNLQATNR